MSDTKPCPSCPDGNEWSSEGPTGRACRTCKGYAVVNLDGSPVAEKFTSSKTTYFTRRNHEID